MHAAAKHPPSCPISKTRVAEAIGIIREVPAARLTERILPQGYDVTVLEAIAHVVEHFSHHTGQIILLTKMLTGDDLRLLPASARFGPSGGRTSSVATWLIGQRYEEDAQYR